MGYSTTYVLAKGRPNAPSSPLPDVLKWHYSGNVYHPTEKAVQTLLPLIQSFSRPNDIVLDPFAGSGSTCEAAYVSGRRYIGIELDSGYHAAGLRRLQQVKLKAA